MEYKNVIKIIIFNRIILALYFLTMQIVRYIGIEQASEIMTSNIIGLVLNNKFVIIHPIKMIGIDLASNKYAQINLIPAGRNIKAMYSCIAINVGRLILT